MKRELRYNKDIVFHIYFLILSFHYRKIPSARRDLFVVWQGEESSLSDGKNYFLSSISENESR